MDIYFINNVNVPFTDRKRKGEVYDKFIDEFFVPADIVCIAGGISDNLNISSTFLIKLAQKYSKVIYVYGGCDLISDMPLDYKFQEIKRSFNFIQKVKCTPKNLDGDVVSFNNYNIAGFMGFDMREDISRWNWWSTEKSDYMDFEIERYKKIINNSPNIDVMVSYYHPDAMNIKSDIKYWHYGHSDKQEIIENDGKLLITNSCHVKNSKYTKKDFLFNI